MKKCSTCQIVKDESEFNKNRAMKDGLQNSCKPCLRRYVKSWEERHTAERQEYLKQYHLDNIEHAHARNNANGKRLYNTSPEYKERKVRQKRESVIRLTATNPEWLAKKREWSRKSAQKRRELKAIAPGVPHTDAEFIALCEYFEGRCVACGEIKKLERDHIVPVSKGGSDSIDNIQPLCSMCNSHKHTKTIDYRK